MPPSPISRTPRIEYLFRKLHDSPARWNYDNNRAPPIPIGREETAVTRFMQVLPADTRNKAAPELDLQVLPADKRYKAASTRGLRTREIEITASLLPPNSIRRSQFMQALPADTRYKRRLVELQEQRKESWILILEAGPSSASRTTYLGINTGLPPLFSVLILISTSHLNLDLKVRAGPAGVAGRVMDLNPRCWKSNPARATQVASPYSSVHIHFIFYLICKYGDVYRLPSRFTTFSRSRLYLAFLPPSHDLTRTRNQQQPRTLNTEIRGVPRLADNAHLSDENVRTV
ncbi:hypothetical protein BJ508DRAFT_312360 [Ascobolus immersus RN42]|uniref:Uncharacterized protein n=1 Tax=Ascobolus immersus RN42 TaxID=1160509 RepID=A0A3N4HR85_ASCIM|nr:hypothetical protein BJ508DRAFT_312360 [Ascobolus immersus RN42]